MFLQTDDCISIFREVNPVAEQLADILDVISNHGWAKYRSDKRNRRQFLLPFQRQSKTSNIHIFGQAHGEQHFWSEQARISYLNPLV